jgi:hypothetical protein
MTEALSVRVLGFRPKRQGTFRGFAKVQLPFGMIIPDCLIHVHGAKVVAYSPVRLAMAPDGKLLRYSSGKGCHRSMIEFATPGEKDAFSHAVGRAVAAAHPSILEP